MLFTEIALLCMFVGARRLALANRYSPSPWSTCIQAPTLRSTNLHPVRVPLLERLRLAGGVDVLVELPHDVGVVPVEGELPLLVRVAELVPAVRGPVVALATGAREALRLGPVRSPGLQDRPVQRVAAPAVGEAVQPALAEVVPRVGLDLDGHVLVVGLLALGRRVVVEPACVRVREFLRPRFGVGEDWLRHAAFCAAVVMSLLLICIAVISAVRSPVVVNLS